MATASGFNQMGRLERSGQREVGISTASLRMLALAAIVLLARGPAVAQTLLPGFRAPMLEEPTEIVYYTGGAPYAAGPAINDPEIQELARGLRYDPNTMYKFVHDHIRFTPSWGETKGPYMTWMDRSGNGFDQASLLIALLTHAATEGTEHTITGIGYAVGEIRPTVAQFANWFGIMGGTSRDATIAKQMLARGGFYAEVDADENDNIENVRMIHVWVTATIDGVSRAFDPSFKTHTIKPGLYSYQLNIGMNYNGTEFLNRAQRQGGGWNTQNIRSDLNTYTTNLVDYIRKNYPTDDLEDIVGGERIKPVDDSNVPATLPYPVWQQRESFGIGNIPAAHRTTLRVQHCEIDHTFYSSDIYGRRLSLQYDPTTHCPVLTLDGVEKARGTEAAGDGEWCEVILTVDHPYKVNDFDASMTFRVKGRGCYHIVNGWGDTGTKVLLKHRGRLQQYKLDGCLDTDESVWGESYAMVGLTWLAKTSAMRLLAAESEDHAIVNHHILGVAGQYDAPYLDLALGHLGLTDLSMSDQADDMFYAVAGHASAYEHEVISSLQECNAVSTGRLFEMANNHPDYNDFFAASTSSIPNWSQIQGQLVGYSQEEKDLITAYVNEGSQVLVPEYGDLAQDDWTGMGFQAIQISGTTHTVAHVVGDGYKGGVSCTQGGVSPSTLLDTSFGAASDGDPEGAYGTGSTDLVIGGGGFPFGLAFGRQYSSHRRGKDGPLGLGWTHNLDISAKVASDSWQLLGADSATDAAAQIVTLHVTRDILATGSHTIASICENWLMDRMKDNVVDIRQGGSSMRFVKGVDGEYHEPPGQAIKLVTQGGTFRLKNTKGIFYDFDSNGQLDTWSDAFGNVVDFSYTNGKLTQVASKIGGTTTSRTLSFTYTGDRITTVTDSASRTVSYTYDGNGQLIQYTNPDGSNVFYAYDATKKGQLRRVYSPVDVVNPFMTIVYDSVDRKRQFTDANNCTWDYYNATYRTEVVEPSQLDPSDQVKRYSTMTWVNPETRKVTSRDQLGRTTVSEYNSQSKVTSVTYASGVSTEYTYDPNNNVVLRGDICIPGSPQNDPNVYHYYDYHSYVSPDGRWFTHMKEQINPAGQVTLYYYDYNEPSPPSRLGKLIKIIHPPVDPPSDPNRPQELFTYNSYGQLETKTGPDGIVTKHEYYTAAEGAGLKKTIVDYSLSGGHLNLATEWTYDGVGRIATIKDPRGNITTKEYYPSGLLKETTGPSCCGASNVSYEYYADGKLKHVKQVVPGESGGGGANDFTSDSNCKALWRFESGALTSDSKGNNTLTNYGVVSQTSDYMEGAGSADIERDEWDWLYISDDGLDSGFPLKSGDTNKIISVAFWVKFESLPPVGNSPWLYGKSGTGKASFWVGASNSSGTTRIAAGIGINGGANWETTSHLSALTAGIWYHVGVTYDDSTRTYRIRIWDDNAKAILGSDKTGNFSSNINVEDGYIIVGYGSDCLMDEMVVFSDVLTTDEIDQIRGGTYGGGTTQGTETVYLQSTTYNSRGLKATERGPYPEGATPSELQVNYTQYFYDNLGRLWRTVDAEGNETRTRYYPDGKVWKVIDAENHNVVVNTYNDDGSLQKVADGKGNETYYSYNGFMGAKRTTYPGGTYEEPTYDEYRRVVETRMRGGQKIQFAYDNLSRVKTKTVRKADNTLVNTITYKYDLAGRLLRTVDNLGTARNTYDNAGRLTQVVYPDGKTVAYQYDAAGNRTRLTYPDSSYINYEYDGMNRLTAVKNSGGTTLAGYTYDARSRREKLDYANGTRIEYLYDVANRMVSVDNLVNSNHYEYAYIYDNVGNRTSMMVTDNGGSRVHVYTYDGTYQVTHADYPSGYDYLASDTTFAYDAAGNRTSVIDAGGTSSYVTNVLNQYTAVGEVPYDYDEDGNLTQDDRFLYDYDPENRLTGATKLAGPPTTLTAACDTTLVLTTGGDAEWFGQRVEYYHDGDAAQSGPIGDSQSSWIETTVEGEGALSFWWNHSSADGDYLEYFIDSVYQLTHASGWQQVTKNIVGTGTHTIRWRYAKNSTGSAGSDCGWLDLVEWTPTVEPPVAELAEGLDTNLDVITYGHADWALSYVWPYYGGDCTRSGQIGHEKFSEMQITVGGEGTLTFWWRVYSESNDALSFYIDDVERCDPISGYVEWEQKTFNVTGETNHTLRWRYAKNGWGVEGDDCGYVDYLQWSGGGPIPPPEPPEPPEPEWQTVSYTYDAAGRRIEKKVDDVVEVKYVYDGDQIIAEYDAGNNLLRKYVYGPGIDQPICMIEASGGYAGTYYYHYDALGSVVALTNSTGNAVQLYEYSVYGQVAASDADHPNRFMFTGREFDKDTGLYYYRARYYHPEIGRFLQTDPIGYRGGMNLYHYCRSNPLNFVDPYGHKTQEPNPNWPKKPPCAGTDVDTWTWEHWECDQWYGATTAPLVEEIGRIAAQMAAAPYEGLQKCLLYCAVIPVGAIVSIALNPGFAAVTITVAIPAYAACTAACDAALTISDWIRLNNRRAEINRRIGEARQCLGYCYCRTTEDHAACQKHIPPGGCVFWPPQP